MISHLYRIENKQTGEYYIGKHNGVSQKKTQGNKLYWGSGNRIVRQIKKYGVENFKYTILVIGEEDYIYDLEKKLVTVDLIESDEKCLNLVGGGDGPSSHSKEVKKTISEKVKGAYSNPELRKKVSDGVKKYFTENPEVIARIAEKNRGRKHTEQARKNMSAAQTGEKNGFYGKTHSPEFIEKIRQINLGNKYTLGHKLKESTKEKIREARIKQIFPEGHYKKVGKTMSSLIWINNGERSKRVKPEVLNQFLTTGWNEGRLMSYIDDKYREQRRQSAIKQWQKVKSLGE